MARNSKKEEAKRKKEERDAQPFLQFLTVNFKNVFGGETRKQDSLQNMEWLTHDVGSVPPKRAKKKTRG